MDDLFVLPVRYYFSSTGFGIILSKDVLIIFGKEKNSVKKEAVRLERKIRSSGRTL